MHLLLKAPTAPRLPLYTYPAIRIPRHCGSYPQVNVRVCKRCLRGPRRYETENLVLFRSSLRRQEMQEKARSYSNLWEWSFDSTTRGSLQASAKGVGPKRGRKAYTYLAH